MNCQDSTVAISSLALESGITSSTDLVSAEDGPAALLANLSARQAKAAGLLTSGTYGQRSSISSASAALQSSLASRLQALTASRGSTLYKLTWKVRTTPSGRSIPALRATVRRISDNDCVGWPTPKVGGDESNLDVFPARQGRAKEKWPDKGMGMPLAPTAQLAAWPTPQSRDGSHGGGSASRAMGEGRHGSNLDDFALLAGWATPATRD